ncbi:hypothetical protein A2819_02315 [Candidatus Azambacteria bacterium RIFCSPHIGHO2_01_FULL_40_24]|uniref:Uncharacterized protein n=1 Tax=Candidatus Azambacteria bacterium RIFCSPHIGHO2_01_FULL_40_24 TaxID=1797301 RepID=A0A1F5B573_9BACT|nr:MAG: hypothetical protein A2819_02315 [Candidatus Azambacteria bacterium RIFCSPHIGHO2_01_FULL_40_24]
MKNLRIKIFAAIIVVILAGGVVYYFAKNQNLALRTWNLEFWQSSNNQAPSSDIPSSNNQAPSSNNQYKNDQFGFSFGYPEGFNISDFDDGGGKIILVKNVGSSVSNNSDNGFQIFIAAFDEPGPITKERILKDIPDMVISNEKEILVGGERALSFTSKDELGGETREIWIARGGYLYQITGYKNFEKELLEIMGTWKFQ